MPARYVTVRAPSGWWWLMGPDGYLMTKSGKRSAWPTKKGARKRAAWLRRAQSCRA